MRLTLCSYLALYLGIAVQNELAGGSLSVHKQDGDKPAMKIGNNFAEFGGKISQFHRQLLQQHTNFQKVSFSVYRNRIITGTK